MKLQFKYLMKIKVEMAQFKYFREIKAEMALLLVDVTAFISTLYRFSRFSPEQTYNLNISAGPATIAGQRFYTPWPLDF